MTLGNRLKLTHRGDLAKAIFKTLNSATFVINTNQNGLFGRLSDGLIKLKQLFGRFEVSAKQDNPTHQRVFKQFSLFAIEPNRV
jgi:hypothetical protein